MKPIRPSRTRLRTASLSLEQSRPSMTICPAVGRSSKPAACSRLDLPEPDGPIRPTISPACTSRSTPFSTCSRRSPDGKSRLTPRRLRIGSLKAQGLDRVEPRRLEGRRQGGDEGGGQREGGDKPHLAPVDPGRNVREEIDL